MGCGELEGEKGEEPVSVCGCERERGRERGREGVRREEKQRDAERSLQYKRHVHGLTER